MGVFSCAMKQSQKKRQEGRGIPTWKTGLQKTKGSKRKKKREEKRRKTSPDNEREVRFRASIHGNNKRNGPNHQKNFDTSHGEKKKRHVGKSIFEKKKGG